MKIIRNAIRCKACGDEIESTHVHDFRWCKCKKVAVDGGHYYMKRCGEPGSWDELSEGEPEPGDAPVVLTPDAVSRVDKDLAQVAVDLIIDFYLPSIRGHAAGGAKHELRIWEIIRRAVANIEVKE